MLSTEQEGPTGANSGWKRNTTLFLVGQTASLFGSSIVQYAVMWYITLDTKSGVAMMLFVLFGFLPQGVLSVFGGVWADRFNRKHLIMIADAVIAAVTLMLAIAMTMGITNLWLILTIVGIRSAGAGIQAPAVNALLPQLVPSGQLLRVNGIFGTINSAMALLAPAAAGVVYAAWSIIPTFYIDVVTAVIGIGILAFVPVKNLAEPTENPSYIADLKAGLSYSWRHHFVRWMLVLYAFVFLLTVAPAILTPLLVAREFGDEVWKLTVLELSFAVGMLIAGLLVATVFAKSKKGVLVLVGCIGFAITVFGLGLAPDLWLFYFFMFGHGLAVPFLSAPATTFLQQSVETEFQGRVFSLVAIIMALATPLGMVVIGPLADVISVNLILVVAGVATLVVVIAAFSSPTGRLVLVDDVPYVAEDSE